MRLAVFVDEQGVPIGREMDEHDRSAVHAVAILSPEGVAAFDATLTPVRSGAATRAVAQAGKYLPLSLSGARGGIKDTGTVVPAVGTARLLRVSSRAVRIGRLAVLPGWRGQGVGSRILRLLEETALARGVQQVVLHAQVQAQDFYLRQGYAVDASRGVFTEDGIAHVLVTKLLSADM